MTVKHFTIFGILILTTLTVLVLLHKENEMIPIQARSQLHPKRPRESKENVNTSVRETIEHLRRVVEDHPDDSQKMFELAQFLQDAHNVQEASEYYKQGLAVDSSNDAARVDYSLCLFEMGRTKESLEQNMIVLHQDPKNAKACYNVGGIYANMGMRDSAEKYWSRVITDHPEGELAAKARGNTKKLSKLASSF